MDLPGPGIELVSPALAGQGSPLGIFFFNFLYLLIDFWLRWVFLAVLGLSLVGESRGYSSRCVASRHVGSVVVARGL